MATTPYIKHNNQPHKKNMKTHSVIVQAALALANIDNMFYMNKENQICRQIGPHELRFGQPNHIENEPIAAALYDMDDCGITYWEYPGEMCVTHNFNCANLVCYIQFVVSQCHAHYENSTKSQG